MGREGVSVKSERCEDVGRLGGVIKGVWGGGA